MYLEILTNKDALKRAELSFKEVMNALCDEMIKTKSSYRGRNPNAEMEDVCYSYDLDMWFYLGEPILDEGSRRYWNVFGLGKPIEGKSTQYVVEINIPFEGVNRRIGGVFAKDEMGNIYLLHRGTIRGSEGIGKTKFLRYYKAKNGVFECVKGEPEEMPLIGKLNDPDFTRKLQGFVKMVQGCKQECKKE